jgi:hypothetical protein
MAGIVLRESAYGTPTDIIKFSHRVVYAGTKVCAANAQTVMTLPGVLATDVVIIAPKVNANSRSVLTVLPAADTITVTFSGATQATDYFFYQVLRAC